MSTAGNEKLVQVAIEIRDQLKRIADALDAQNAPHREWKLDRDAQDWAKSHDL